jgi:hypothetical protein
MDPLHELIQSMSASEKGYFKKYASPKNGGDYVKLFDAIASMPVYDDEKLLSRFKKVDRVKNLARSKNYLYNAVIRSLLSYHEQSSPKIIIRTLLNEAEMLYNRGLLQQVRKRLDKAKVLAREGEWFTLWLDVLSQQRKLCDMRIYAPEELQADQITQEIDQVTKQMLNFIQYNEIYQHQDYISKTSTLVRGKEVEEKLLQILRLPLMESEKHALSVKALLTYNYIRYWNGMMLQDYSLSRTHALRQLEIAQANPKIQESNPVLILDIYNMILSALQFVPDDELSEKYMKEFRELELANTYQEVVRFQYYSTFAIKYYIDNRKEKEMVTLADDVRRKLKIYRSTLKEDMRLSLLVAMADGYLRFGRYNHAVDVIELYRQRPPKDLRHDYQNYLLFFYLIAHYELGNKQFVANLLTNVERFMKRAREFSKIDNMVLKAFSFAIEIPDKRTRNIRLKELKHEIMDEVKQAGRKWKNYETIIMPFIEARIRGIKYHELIALDN